MRHILLLISLTFCHLTFSQRLTVKEINKAEIVGLKKVKIGDTIPKNSNAIVKKDGVLKLEDSLGFQINLFEGKYNIDSTFNQILISTKKTDELNKIADANIVKYFPNGLTTNETYICGTMRMMADSSYFRSHYLANNSLFISNSVDNSNVTKVAGDSITFFIEDAQKDENTYFYKLTTFWNECIVFEKIDGNTFSINLKDLPADDDGFKAFFMEVYTLNGRKGYKITISDEY